jgi:hypothetical protein
MTLLLFVLLVLLGACATPEPTSPAFAAPANTAIRSPKNAASNVSTQSVPLVKGMPATQVVALLGEPAEKKPMKTASGSGEIWVYRRSFEEHDGYAPAGSTVVQEYGTPGPTGERAVVYRERALYTEQYRYVDETTLILIVAGQVVEWDRSRKGGAPFTK